MSSYTTTAQINGGRRRPWIQTTQNVVAALSLLISSSVACRSGTLIQVGLSEYDKQAIVDMHNRMRQSVALGQVRGQPPASNMMEMRWDNDLANRAQIWASNCIHHGHDTQRHSRRYYVGQNIASTWTTKPPSSYYDMQPEFSKEAVDKWFEEFRNYKFNGFNSGTVGHYTQMVWADSASVGCGYAFYYDPSRGFTKKYVCNYGPSGNIYGQTPYRKGYPNCYELGMSESRKYAGLCAQSTNFYFDPSKYNNYLGWH